MKKIFVLLLLTTFLVSCGSSTKLIWMWTLQSRCYAQPIIDGNTVYVVSQKGEVVSGEIESGKKNWSIKVNGPILADPDFNQDHLFVSTQNGSVIALKKKDGGVFWSVSYPEEAFTAPLTVVKEMVLVPTRNGNIYALSTEDGHLLWKHEGNLKYNTKIMVDDPYLLIGGWNWDFLCFRMDGSVNWKYRASFRIVENALIHKNDVYFTAHDHYIYALDIPTGKLKWRFRADSDQPTELVRVENELLVGSKDFLEILDPQTGKRIRRIKTPRIVDRLYSWNNKCVFVSTDVYIVDPKTGDIKVLIPGKGPYFKIAFGKQRFVVSDENTGVYGYSIDPELQQKLSGTQ
jgi:eukaryotic-like serine/threonine-protein kinase